MTDNQPIGGGDGTHDTSAAELFGPLQRGSDIWHTDVEHRMALVARSTADPTADTCPIVSRDEVQEAIVIRCRHLLNHRKGHRKLPPKELGEVVPKSRWVFSDDLEVHHGLCHVATSTSLAMFQPS